MFSYEWLVIIILLVFHMHFFTGPPIHALGYFYYTTGT